MSTAHSSACGALGALLLLSLPATSCGAQQATLPPAVHPLPRVVDGTLPPVALEPAFGELRFQRPVDLQWAPGDVRGAYVAEQRGVVFRVLPGIQGWVPTPFLDIAERTCRTGNEEGLLGLAFSPHFAQEGHPQRGVLYVNYSVRPGPLSRLSRFRVPAGQAVADPASEEVLLEVEQPYRNHNGGALLFGPDGLLYWALGDGGSADDPHGNGQRLDTLLGKVLRLDVGPRDDDRPYGIPADNPFVAAPGARPEIWAFGLRNAWRLAFDRETGELWAGDVGQNLHESVFVLRAGGNHGWNLLEGFHRFRLPAGEAPPADLVPPVWSYPHMDAAGDAERAAGDVGLSITGGCVYRGRALPELTGWYVCADYVTQNLWAIRRLPPDPDGRPVVERVRLAERAGILSSFGQDPQGELLLVEHMGRGPSVRRLVPAR